jgi:hypothetical protein
MASKDELSFVEFLQRFKRSDLNRGGKGGQTIKLPFNVEDQRRAHCSQITAAATVKMGSPVFFGRAS